MRISTFFEVKKQFLLSLSRGVRTSAEILGEKKIATVPIFSSTHLINSTIQMRSLTSRVTKSHFSASQTHHSSKFVHLASVVLAVSFGFFSRFFFDDSTENTNLSFGDLNRIIEILEIPDSELEKHQDNLHSVCLKKAYLACKDGKWDKIDLIGCDLLSKLRNKQGDTLIKIVISNCEESIILKLLDRKIGLKEVDKKGNTPLHFAAQRGFFSSMRLLITYFNVESRNHNGDTPLHVAILSGQEEGLGPLVEVAELNKQNKTVGNLLHFAVSCGQFQIIDYLLTKHYKKISPLMEETDAEGRTPLALAAYLGETIAIHKFIQFGANLEAKDLKGRTSVHWACQGLQSEALDSLIYYGAKIDALDDSSQRPEDILRAISDKKSQAFLARLLDIQTSRPSPLALPSPFDLPPEILVFQGGGSKAFGYIPALEELENRKVLGSLERTVGTSAGAILAGLIAVGYTSKDLKKYLEKVDFNEWQDYPPTLKDEIDDIKKYYNLQQVSKEGPNAFDVLDGIWKAVKITLIPSKRKAVTGSWKEGGICEGKIFLDWIEERIKGATGIEYCTFGDLANFIKDRKILPTGKEAKHLHVFVTKLGEDPRSIEINSEDPQWENVIISDAIRMSMSIPVAFKPHVIHRRVNSKRVPCEKEGVFVDGGLLANFPIKKFNFKRYKKNCVEEEKPEHEWDNPRVWGFSLYHPKSPQPRSEHSSMSDVFHDIAILLWNAENLMNENETKKVIRIDDQGIGLLDFDPPPQKKQALLDGAQKVAQSFLHEFQKGKLGRSSYFYDFGLFQKKDAERGLYLPFPHSDFIGREEELNQLQIELVENKNWKDKTVVKPILAPSGYGKSELAITFASANLEKFSYIWQLDLRNQETFERSYSNLARALQIPTSKKGNVLMSHELFKEVNKRLETQASSLPWLLIFDNADDQITIPFPQKGGCILITSQQDIRYGENALKLKGLALQDAKKLMAEITGENEQELVSLAGELKYIPILVNQAAHFIAHTPTCKASDYRQLLKDRMDKKGVGAADGKSLLSACWEISSKYLGENMPEALDWLTLCAYFNNKGIPKLWLTEWLAKRDGGHISLKHYKKQKEIFEFLKKYGLIYSHPYDETFSLHGLFQNILIEGQKSQQSTLLGNFIPFLVHLSEIKNFNPTHTHALDPFRRALPHCSSVLTHLNDNSDSHLKLRLLLTMIRYYIETERNLVLAENYLREADQWTHDLKHPIKGKIFFYYGLLSNKKASSATDPGKLYQDAITFFGEARNIFTSCSNSNDYTELEQNKDKCNQEYQQAIVLDYLAQTQLNLNLLDKSKNTFKQAKKEFKEVYRLYPNLKHFDLARIIRDKGQILMKRGDYSGALRKVNKALAMQKTTEVYGDDFSSHPTVAVTYSMLGDIYSAMNSYKDLEKADDAYHEAIRINKRAFKTKYHSYNVRIYEKRAEVAEKLGNKEKVQKLKDKATEIDNYLKRQMS